MGNGRGGDTRPACAGCRHTDICCRLPPALACSGSGTVSPIYLETGYVSTSSLPFHTSCASICPLPHASLGPCLCILVRNTPASTLSRAKQPVSRPPWRPEHVSDPWIGYWICHSDVFWGHTGAYDLYYVCQRAHGSVGR